MSRSLHFYSVGKGDFVGIGTASCHIQAVFEEPTILEFDMFRECAT